MAFKGEVDGAVPKTVVWDGHLTLLTPGPLNRFLPGSLHHPNSFFYTEEEAVMKSHLVSRDQAWFESMCYSVAFGEERPKRIPHIPIQRPADYLVEIVYGIIHTLDRLARYEMRDEAKEALRKTKEELGFQNTIITNMMGYMAPAFERRLNKEGVTPYLNQKLSVVYRRPLIPKELGWPFPTTSTTAGPLLGMGLVIARDGVPPFEVNDSDGINWKATEFLNSPLALNTLSSEDLIRWNIPSMCLQDSSRVRHIPMSKVAEALAQRTAALRV